ncbi:MAG: leucine-rich repeat protein [Oscillibacter sp.]|jgi:hypothetical protein|nr:leucine-rich repeat protein [Oscillibacter sp.]
MKLRLLSLLLALTLVLSLLPVGVAAADEDPDIVEYQGLEFNKVTHTIQKCILNSSSIVIPSQIEGETVEKIADRAFVGATMTSVTIPNTIKEIGDSAFDRCSGLKTVVLHGGGTVKLAIGQRAFASTGITSLILPARVSSVGDSAFMDNDSLVTAVLRTGIDSFGAEVFADCEILRNVVIPGMTYNSNPFFDCGSLEIIHYLGGTIPLIPELNSKIKVHPATILSSGDNTPVDRCLQDGMNPETAYCRNNDDSCGMKIDSTLYITANPHTLEDIEEVDVSCTENGSSGGKKCTVCKQIIVQPTVTNALGHNYVIDLNKGDNNTGIELKDSTCKDTGLKKTYMKCDRTGCGDEYVEEEIIEKKVDHSYAGGKTVEVGKGYNLKEPTCVDVGSEIALRVCDDCEQAEVIDEKHIKDEHGETPVCTVHTTRDIPALGHVKGEKWIPDPAYPDQKYDCSKGTGEETIHVIYQCTRCEKFPTDDSKLKAEIKVPAGEHSYGEPVKLTGEGESKDPTCTEKGQLVTQRTCTVCGFKEGKVTKELDALGHNVTNWTTTKEPTCTENGTRSGICENPGCGQTIEEPIEKLDHDFDTNADKGTVKVPATCTQKGVLVVTCSRCDETEEREIEMLPHSPKAPEKGKLVKAATCTEEGSMVYDTVCKDCGTNLQNTPIPIPALGHDFGPWTTSGSTRTRTCKREGCGYKETDASSTPSNPSEPSNPSNPGSSSNTYYSVDVIRPANGSISVSTSSARADTRVTVTLRPNSGYQLDSVWVTRSGSGRNVALSGNGTNRYTFIMPAARVEVRAAFSSISGTSTNTTTPPNDRNTNPTKNVVVNIPQISSASTPAGSRVFVDVPSSFWAQGEIAWACQKGFISGSGGNFFPNNPITVRQLWMVMARMMGKNPANMEEARLWALNNGFADGGNPNAALTRIQLATMLYRCARLMGSKNTNTTNLGNFTDSRNIPASAKNAMAWAVANGIITGTTDGRLNPSGTVSRAQFCVILYRYYQRLF